MDYCFAVRREDTILYSILAKTAGAVPESTVNAALSHYFTEDAEMIRSGLIRENLRIGLGALFAGGLLAALVVLLFSVWRRKREAKRQERILSAEDFRLMDDLPVSYSVYRVTHAEHSELYDAEIIYVNHKYEQLGGLPAEAVLGHRVRQLYPFLGEEWFRNVKRAVQDGETVESDHVDVLTRKRYHITVRQMSTPGYCAITYLETEQGGG
jgi:PAS domain-containing protein